MDDSTTLSHVGHSSQFCVIHRLDDSTLWPIIQIIKASYLPPARLHNSDQTDKQLSQANIISMIVVKSEGKKNNLKVA